jgi:hypothetical protein
MRAGAEARRARGIGHPAGGFGAFQAARLKKARRDRSPGSGGTGTDKLEAAALAALSSHMNTAYRLYLGARNIGSRVFSERDLAMVEAILNEHFHGWTTAKAIGRWRGKTEETLVITFTSEGIKMPRTGPSADHAPAETMIDAKSASAALERCVAQLKEHLGQESVLLEQGGPVGIR